MFRKVGILFLAVMAALVMAPLTWADTLSAPPSNGPADNGVNVPAVFTQWARVVRKSYTYGAPGGAPVRYLDDWDTWLSIRGSRVVNGQTWYLTSQGTWVSAGDVRFFPVTQFQGYQFQGDEQGDLGFILENATHVHAKPADNANDLGYLARYTPVAILGMDNGWFRIADGQWVNPRFVRVVKRTPRPANIGPAEKWIDVNLTQQTLVAYEGDQPVFATLTSTGKGTTPTATGLFRIYRKLISHTMAGGTEDKDPYTLDEVPWSMYFYQGFALHGAYWHDQFGAVRSHGCVNLSPADAKFLFGWTGPVLPAGSNAVGATNDNPGTWVYVHY